MGDSFISSANYTFSHREALDWLEKMREFEELKDINIFQAAAIISFFSANGFPGGRPFSWQSTQHKDKNSDWYNSDGNRF